MYNTWVQSNTRRLCEEQDRLSWGFAPTCTVQYIHHLKAQTAQCSNYNPNLVQFSTHVATYDEWWMYDQTSKRQQCVWPITTYFSNHTSHLFSFEAVLEIAGRPCRKNITALTAYLSTPRLRGFIVLIFRQTIRWEWRYIHKLNERLRAYVEFSVPLSVELIPRFFMPFFFLAKLFFCSRPQRSWPFQISMTRMAVRLLKIYAMSKLLRWTDWNSRTRLYQHLERKIWIIEISIAL